MYHANSTKTENLKQVKKLSKGVFSAILKIKDFQREARTDEDEAERIQKMFRNLVTEKSYSKNRPKSQHSSRTMELNMDADNVLRQLNTPEVLAV